MSTLFRAAGNSERSKLTDRSIFATPFPQRTEAQSDPASTGPRIRVLLLIARMNVGGPAQQVLTLTNGIDPGRFETRLLIGSVEPGEEDFLKLRKSNVGARRVDGLARSVRAAGDGRAFLGILAEIRRFRPHILHTHTAKAGVLGRLAATGTRVPSVVHTFHGHLLHGYFSPPVTRGIVLVERSLARITTRLVAVGSRVRDELLEAKIGSCDQYTVVPPGVDLAAAPTRDTARQALGLPSEVPVVVFVARLTAIKRPDRFMDVAQRLVKRCPGTILLVVGEGELLEETKSSAKHLGSSIRFLGWREDIESVYAAADVVVLTSDNEGMPVSLIEAALAGRPAVTTAVGSAGEVVRDGVTGFVCSKDADQITSALERLLLDRTLREQMGVAALQRARHEFSTRRLLTDTELLYEQIAAEKGFG